MRETFVTTSRGLWRQSPPMRLYEKAKRLGVWNPSDIDLRQDVVDWAGLTAIEQDLLLCLTSLFQAGEEAVTLDLLPLIMTIAAEGRLEEEMYLTTFLFEEAKHTDFFSRFLSEVVGSNFDLAHYQSSSYREIFYEALPTALQALHEDRSPTAQARAAVTYNLVVEGILAETGYHAYFAALTQNNILPGTRRGIEMLKQDESRHIAYGIFLLSRLIAADDSLWTVVEETMNALLIPALGIIGETFSVYNPAPFGFDEHVFIDYALGQFQKRIERVEKARGMSLAELEKLTEEVIDQNDG